MTALEPFEPFEPFDPANPKSAFERIIRKPAQGEVHHWPEPMRFNPDGTLVEGGTDLVLEDIEFIPRLTDEEEIMSNWESLRGETDDGADPFAFWSFCVGVGAVAAAFVLWFVLWFVRG